MSASREAVFDTLRSLDIPFERYEHPPVATVAEAEAHWQRIDAAHCKNLFLRNQRGDRHYLVIAGHSKRVDLRQLADQIGDGKLSFASPERLMKWLGLTPGAVSPFGLLNDAAHHVRVFLDSDLRRAERITFHPNDDTVTLALGFADFERFLQHVGHAVRVVSI
ncbi:MAG: prolyl-tRNA synthetase associated domain-containing protein [Vicinamibacteria bacterium]|nr:prolyl-tRNA synthetase associated domain-containing protein [Vicinamibacteria bacterium]